MFLWLFSLYRSSRAFSRTPSRGKFTIPSWSLSLHLSACLSLNDDVAYSSTLSDAGRSTRGDLAVSVLRFSGGWGGGVVSAFPGRILSSRWNELTCGGRERESERGESTLGRANPDFRLHGSRRLSLTGGFHSHWEQGKTLIGPPTLVQCFGLSWRLSCFMVVVVHFFFIFYLMSEWNNGGEVVTLRIALGKDKHRLSLS